MSLGIAADQVHDLISHATLLGLAAEISALHQVISMPDGSLVCDHCCLNGIHERRFSCLDHHDHRHTSSPCPTLAILERLGLWTAQS